MICEERLAILKLDKKNGIGSEKRFAGVCADFASITSALLREAGFPAGVMTGYSMNGKTAERKDSHATACIPWPDGKGGIRFISVDGTPGSSDPAYAWVQGESLGEKEKGSDIEVREEVMAANIVIEELLQAIQANNVEAIQKLSNGQLEKALNVILQYEVKKSHVHIIESVLSLYQYSGIAHIENKIEKDIELRKMIEGAMGDAIARERRFNPLAEAGKEKAGTALMDVAREYMDKFVRAGIVKNKVEALDKLEQIAELASRNLDPVEQRAFAAVIGYIRAKKMT